jgi:hypothetical protein
MKVLIILSIIIVFLLKKYLWVVKCPKCNKKCNASYYVPGVNDSLYYECPEHGDLNLLKD